MVRDHHFEILTADFGPLLCDTSCRVAQRRTLESPSPNDDRIFLQGGLGHIAEGSWLPGMGDVRTISGLTNRSPRTIEDSVIKSPRRKYHVGRTVLYRLDDFAK